MQIFGRAEHPQYDISGDAVLVTTQDQLPHYLGLLTTGIPMESALIKALPDHLNAEIVSGTVSNLEEACTWLSYTYLYVRMRKNPLAYGMKWVRRCERRPHADCSTQTAAHGCCREIGGVSDDSDPSREGSIWL